MTLRVGIPRGLLYYEYFPLWREFFTALGAEVVQSPPTNKQLFEQGLHYSLDETCLPVKLYMGHVAALIDRVDYLFVPRIVSISKGDYHCPKFSGLPDMVRSIFPKLPPILEVVADRTEHKGQLLKSIYRIGALFRQNPVRIYGAYRQALKYWRETAGDWEKSLLPHDVFHTTRTGPTVAVIGHSYNLYDIYCNHNLLELLQRMGVGVVTPEQLTYKRARATAETHLPGLCWSMGKRLYGTAIEYAGQKEIDGIILVTSFECGIDSLLMDTIERELLHYKKPAMLLVIDEHTGEAGVITRLEAFVDMLKRRGQP